MGLFGLLENATVENVTVADSYFNAGADYSYAGGIAAQAGNSTISCCETRVNVYAMVSGGITAEAHSSEIVNCSSVGTIDSFTRAGGITAIAMESTIKNCFYAGAVTTSLQGRAIPIAACETISNCYYDKNQFPGQTDSYLVLQQRQPNNSSPVLLHICCRMDRKRKFGDRKLVWISIRRFMGRKFIILEISILMNR